MTFLQMLDSNAFAFHAMFSVNALKLILPVLVIWVLE